MRKLLFGLVGLLLLAGPAFGAVGFTVLGPATVDNPGDPIAIQIQLSQADPRVASWGADLVADKPMTIGAYAATTAYPTGWNAGNALGWTEGQALPIFGLGTNTAAGTTDVGAPAIVLNATLFAAAEGIYTITLENLTGGDAGAGDIEDFAPTVPLIVNVLPEPVSALLLLAGLPMLRRRR